MAEFNSFSDILKNKTTIKPPAYPWQDLALRIIKELSIPEFKRSAVFKICKEKPTNIVEAALIDTKELCKNGLKWKYFFKVIDQSNIDKKIEVDSSGNR
ncbi:MAG: hypothetical protein NTX66_03675 [Candidatus Falkowbacteria bacterium]|nr:hypothetical protein [Candidatus Falkowbacteria bacterium]